MELRSHPLMSYRGIPNWPPTWTKVRGLKGRSLADRSNATLKGEIGTLYEVIPSSIEPHMRIFLVIEIESNAYMGTLLFKDAAFCRQLTEVLQGHLGKTMKEIGCLDLSYTL